jgi:hypothetical protein
LHFARGVVSLAAARWDIFLTSTGATMKQVFLIHAHKDLALLNGLVGQLRDEDFIIYVNLDRKCAIDPAQLHPAAQLVRQRINIDWGGFSQVAATLNSLQEIVTAVPAFDKVVFLSGQDFPLLPNDRLKQELARLAGKELIDAVAIGPAWPVRFRYQYFYREGGSAAARLACGLVNRAMRLLGLHRAMVKGYQPYGGSQWWSLSRDCIVELLQLARDPAVLRFFRSVSCPDEMFFQTLVMNSRFRQQVLGQNFRHIQWPGNGARNPDLLDEEDFGRICASDAHFCRKIDSIVSAALLPRLVTLRASRAAGQAGMPV